MTEAEKELIAQEAELMGFPDTARSIRAYCWTPQTRAVIVRLQTFAHAFAWDRIPGWRRIVATLPKLSRAPRMASRARHPRMTSPAPKKLIPTGARDSLDGREAAGGGAGDHL